MGDKSSVELAPLPAGLAPAPSSAPGAPEPAPAAGGPPSLPFPAGPPKPKDDAEDDVDDVLDLDELAPMLGDVYADAFAVVGKLYVGMDVELPDKRAEKRGRQLAIVLKRLGWTDSEILCYVGLTAGVARDFSDLHALKKQVEAQRAQEAEKGPAAPRSSTPTPALEPAIVGPAAGAAELPGGVPS